VPWDAAPSAGAHAALPESAPPPSVLPGVDKTQMGRVVDALVADAGVNTFLCRLPHPLGTCSRMVLLVPPQVVGTAAFADGAHVIAGLCKALGAPALVVAQDQDANAIREELGRAADIRTDVLAYASSWTLLPTLTDHVRPADLLLLWGAREGEAAFSSEYRDFVVRVFSRWADHDIVVLYPRAADSSLGVQAAEPAPKAGPMPQRTLLIPVAGPRG